MANNVKADLEVIGYKGANCVKWSAAENTVMTPPVPRKAGNFLTR